MAVRVTFDDDTLGGLDAEAASPDHLGTVARDAGRALFLEVTCGQDEVSGGMRAEVSFDPLRRAGEELWVAWDQFVPAEFAFPASYPEGEPWMLMGQFHDQPDPLAGQTWDDVALNDVEGKGADIVKRCKGHVESPLRDRGICVSGACPGLHIHWREPVRHPRDGSRVGARRRADDLDRNVRARQLRRVGAGPRRCRLREHPRRAGRAQHRVDLCEEETMIVVYFVCEDNHWFRSRTCAFDGTDNPFYDDVQHAIAALQASGEALTRETLRGAGLGEHILRRLVVVDMKDPVPQAIRLAAFSSGDDYQVL
ncbi:MAG: hypothetical protein ABMA64_34165 [Myxococcota bacterium]